MSIGKGISGAAGFDYSKSAEKVRLIAVIMVTLTVISVIQCYLRAAILRKEFPLTTFLTAPLNMFGDFFTMHDQWVRLKFTGIGYGLAYFPSTYLFLHPFTLKSLGWEALVPFMAVMISGILLCIAYGLRGLRFTDWLMGFVVLTACNYGVLFTLNTGNWEGIVFIILALGCFLFAREHYRTAAVFIGLAASMKLFPLVFGVLFLAERRWRYLGWFVLSGVVFSLLPLLIFPGGFRDGIGTYLHNLRASQGMYFELMVLGGAGDNFGHSLLNCWKRLTLNRVIPIQSVLTPWLVFTVVAFCGVAWKLIRSRPPLWVQMMALTCCMNLFPFSSTDYKLIHFLIPVLLFIQEKSWGRREQVVAIGMGVLLAPRSFWYLHNNPYHNLTTVITPVLMLLFLGAMLTWRKESVVTG